MRKMKKIFWTLVTCCFLFVPSVSSADEMDLFSYNVPPDALIVLDLSGSLWYTAAGRYMWTKNIYNNKGQPVDPDCSSTTNPFYPDASHSGYTAQCDYITAKHTYDIPICAANSQCLPPFYIGSSSGCPTNYPTDCSRVAIARRAIFNLLDYDNSGTVNSDDEKSFRVRIGYMRFYNCGADDSPWSYTAGCNTKIVDIPTTDPPYSSSTSYSYIWSKVSPEQALGGTPLATALKEARLYLDDHKKTDPGASCRQKFAVLITDGQDTRACGANGQEEEYETIGGKSVNIRYRARRASLAAAYELKQAGYKLFVIGFGADLPEYLSNTLEWMAYHGGTNNPDATDSGVSTPPAITPTSYTTDDITNKTGACAVDGSNDPASVDLTGYAYFARDAQSLSDSLTKAFNYIASSRISFSVTTVAAFRVTSENYLYQASFQPLNGDPFWLGHLQKYSLNSDGSLGSVIWDAGSLLQDRNYSTRKLYTLISKQVVDFSDTSGPLSPPGQAAGYLNTDTNTGKMVMGYILGNPSYNPDNWKLGDIFHSDVMNIGSPSPYFVDVVDRSNAYDSFQSNKANRQRIVMVGANDGQFHAFNASDGTEMWSFIPPNQLPRLKFIAHQKDPTTLIREYFIDGGASAADVWLGSGDGKSKVADGSEWSTYLVFGEGKGVRDITNRYPIYQWSSSETCDSQSPATAFTKDYDSAHPYYCGYYAFDVTNTGANPPSFKWLLNFKGSSYQTQQYLGEPWSKMVMGRVIIDGKEKWVGFIGGGYATEANRGKGFFVVDLSDGHVLWSYTYADNSSMNYPIPASPAIVDWDNDGFVDTAYVGDLGGNVWRFTFCTKKDDNTCGKGTWSGGLLYDASGSGRPIYNMATAARGDARKDKKEVNTQWVFWGTGDRENPVSTTGQDRFFAVIDPDRTSPSYTPNPPPLTIGSLQDISGTGTLYDRTSSGWVISFAAGGGEKVLSDPTVFGGVLLFTTYTPDSSDPNPCSRVGSAKLYAIAMMSVALGKFRFDAGAGFMSYGGARSVTLGAGIAKSPVLSQNPLPSMPTDLYITLSGGGTANTSIITNAQLGPSPVIDLLASTYPSLRMLYWRDGRL
jgi:hypothetical protein